MLANAVAGLGGEANVAVILHTDELDVRNHCVTMTRDFRELVVCARSPHDRPMLAPQP